MSGVRILFIYKNKWRMPFRKIYTQKIGFCTIFNYFLLSVYLSIQMEEMEKLIKGDDPNSNE